LKVDYGFHSCTDRVQAVRFTFQAKQVVLVDTPGFDHTALSDLDVLEVIADFLKSIHERGIHVYGIIFKAAIRRTARNYVAVVQAICGPSGCSNMVIMPHWSLEDRSMSREPEEDEETFCKTALVGLTNLGARVLKSTEESSTSVLRLLLLDKLPNLGPLMIQSEMIAGAEVWNTTAGMLVAGLLFTAHDGHEAGIPWISQLLDRLSNLVRNLARLWMW